MFDPHCAGEPSRQVRDRVNAILAAAWSDFGTRLTRAERRLSVLLWLASLNLAIGLLTLAYVFR